MTDDAAPPVHARRLMQAVVDAANAAGDATAEVEPPESVPTVGGTDSEVVYREHGIELHRYEPAERRHRTPILVVYALVNRPYILDLQPDRSVVQRLLEAGFSVYLIDWGEPSRLDQALGLADYVGRYLDNSVDATLDDAGAADLHLLGYCMGGTMAAMYAARSEAPLRTLTTMATPFAFDGTGGILEQWATHLDPETLVEVYGNVPRELMALTFAMMEPVQNTVGKLARLYDNADDPEFVATFLRMERWIWDGVDVPGRVIREFVGEIYQDDALVAGSFDLAGQPVDFGAVSVPTQTLIGEYDNLVPPASTRPIDDALGSEDTRVVEYPVGHVGLSVSGAAHDELWPDVAGWLAERSAPLERPDRGTSEAPTLDDRARAKATVEALSRRASAAVSADGGARPAAADRTSAPVESIDGIGATYARRLGAAGIETVADLRGRDPAALTRIAEAPMSRVEDWLQRAR